MNKEEIDNLEDYLRNKLTKIEPTIPITNFGSVDLDDLMDNIKQFKIVPTYDELLRENKKLRSQLEEKDKIIEDLKKDLNLVIEYGQGEEASNWDKQYGKCAENVLNTIDKLEKGQNIWEIK